MLKLRPFKNCDAEIITGWIKDEYSFRQWSVDRYKKFPPRAKDMIKLYQTTDNNDSFFGFTAYDEKGVCGHFTVRFTDGEKKIARLGFIIVDDSRRGTGLGKELVTLGIRYCLEFLMAEKITLGVFENNTAAYRCYLSAGFKEVTLPETEYYRIGGESWKCIEMEYEG